MAGSRNIARKLIRQIEREEGRDRLPDFTARVNKAEAAFLLRAVGRKKDTEILRAGWPDFLLIESGKPYCVEVKTRPDNVRPRQAAMFAALEALGLPVYVWSPEEPKRLLPWRKWRCGPLPEGDCKGEPETAVNRGRNASKQHR